MFFYNFKNNLKRNGFPRRNLGPAIRSNTILPTLQKPTKNGITTSVRAILKTSPARVEVLAKEISTKN